MDQVDQPNPRLETRHETPKQELDALKIWIDDNHQNYQTTLHADLTTRDAAERAQDEQFLELYLKCEERMRELQRVESEDQEITHL